MSFLQNYSAKYEYTIWPTTWTDKNTNRIFATVVVVIHNFLQQLRTTPALIIGNSDFMFQFNISKEPARDQKGMWNHIDMYVTQLNKELTPWYDTRWQVHVDCSLLLATHKSHHFCQLAATDIVRQFTLTPSLTTSWTCDGTFSSWKNKIHHHSHHTSNTLCKRSLP